MQSMWVLALLIVTVPLAGRIYWRRRRRTRELLSLARRKGLTFSALDLIGLHERYYNLQVIRQGHSRHAWNVLYGSLRAGLVAVFRYGYDVGFGVHQVNRQWWVAVLECTQALPSWRAETAGSNPGRARSGPSADEESEGQPERPDDVLRVGQFVVRPEGQAARALLQSTELQAALLGMTCACYIECSGILLAMAAPSEEQDASQPERLLDDICSLAEVAARGQKVEESGG